MYQLHVLPFRQRQSIHAPSVVAPTIAAAAAPLAESERLRRPRRAMSTPAAAAASRRTPAACAASCASSESDTAPMAKGTAYLLRLCDARRAWPNFTAHLYPTCVAADSERGTRQRAARTEFLASSSRSVQRWITDLIALRRVCSQRPRVNQRCSCRHGGQRDEHSLLSGTDCRLTATVRQARTQSRRANRAPGAQRLRA
jgi:hypothetical protein